MVDGLEDSYGDSVDFQVKDWKAEDSLKEIEKLNFEDGHGMVMHGADGTTTWQEASHMQWKKPDEVEAEVKKLAGGG